MANFKKTAELSKWIGKQVGSCRINNSWVHHNNSYECAAWWEDSKIVEGIYPLILKENTFAPYNLILVSQLQAIVVDDYFPALFGGNPISGAPKSTNVGQKRAIHHKFDIIECIDRTGDIPDSPIDVFFNPELINLVLDSMRQEIDNQYQMMGRYYEEYKEKGEGKYGEHIRMVGYFGREISKLVEGVDKILNKQRSSSYLKECREKNVQWAKVA